MADDGRIVWQVDVDTKKAKVDIEDVTKTIKNETSKWDDAAKKSTNSISDSFTGMLKKVAAGFSAVKIGKALLDIGSAAVSAASDLQEVQNVVDVTFGESANKIEKWAKDAGTQFGLTETQAKKFSSTMGAMLKSSGLAGDQIVEVSTDLAGLAADMASFYNLDFEEAFSKIRSGMSGMTMPLKELGIDMSVDTMNAFALEKGLKKTFNQMTQSEQTMLRYQYLMKATADAQGDFARTSDGYANGLRTLETNIETLKTKLGELLVPAVNSAIQWLNETLASITSDGKTRTVIDDFADIDAETERKLEKIKSTAQDARDLTSELDAINRSKIGDAGKKVEQLATDLSNIDLNQDKAGVITSFISTLATDIPTLAALTGSSNEGAKKWLEGIADSASKLTPEDAQGWKDLIASIKEGLPGLENTDFGAAFFAALGDGFKDIKNESTVLDWAIDTLGSKTNRTAEEQAYWLQICKNLVKTIPGLSSIINTETGEIKGGTQAVKDYIKAWEEGQTKLVLFGALEQKESALSSRFSDLPGLQLDMALAEKRVRDQRKKIDDLLTKYGRSGFNTYDEYGRILFNNPGVGLSEEEKEIYSALEAYNSLVDAQNEARKSYNEQKEALEEAKQALEEYRKAIEEQYGSDVKITEITEEWSDEAKNAARTVVQAASEALTALDDYVQGVHDSVAKSVDGIIKGFDRVRKAGDEMREKQGKLGDEYTDTEHKLADKIRNAYKTNGAVDLAKMSANWNELTKEEQAAYNELVKIKNKQDELTQSLEQYTTTGMKKGLNSQLEFMKEYLANLETARSYGLSDELLASLSDGSAESAEYLAGLVAGGKEAAQEVDAIYKQVQEKKKEFTDQLTDQTIAADEVYQNLASKAKEAVQALDLAGEAQENTGKTIAGIAQGISDHVPDVKEQVDNIIAQLDRLNGYGISIDFGGFGKITFKTSTGENAKPARMGLLNVPHDDYLARLHEGERVLTAQEAQKYNALMNGGVAGFGLDELGGVMRDNVKPGGNVYLDGRIVGSVISEQQGRSYRQLQRSGWQS